MKLRVFALDHNFKCLLWSWQEAADIEIFTSQVLPTLLMLILFVFHLDKSLKDGKGVCNVANSNSLQDSNTTRGQNQMNSYFLLVFFLMSSREMGVRSSWGCFYVVQIARCWIHGEMRWGGCSVTGHHFSQKITLKLWKSHSVPLSKMWLREMGEILICRKIVVSALWQKHSIQDGEACYSLLETCGGCHVMTLYGKKSKMTPLVTNLFVVLSL